MGTAGGGGVINPLFIHASTHTLQRIIKELKNSITCKCDIHSDIFLPKGLKTFTAVFLCARQERLNQDFYLALLPKLKAYSY